MELPVNTLIILAIGIIVLLAVFVGIILPSRSGGDEASKRTDFTLLCNKWAIDDCGEGFYGSNEESIKKVADCSDFSSCRSKCERAGLCPSEK